MKELRLFACDSRWRVREAVAIGLQRVGDHDLDALFDAIEPWVTARPYLQRAAVAAVCEPRLAAFRPPRLRAYQGGRRMQPVRAHEAVVISAECAMGCWTKHPPG